MRHRVLVLQPGTLPEASLGRVLVHQGYRVRCVASWDQAVGLVSSDTPADALILDLEPGDLGAPELCRSVRETGFQGAVVALAHETSELHRVAALDAGADVYLVKPCAVAELLARLRALLRRTAAAPRIDPADGRVIVDTAAYRAYAGPDHGELALTRMEFEVLATLAVAREQVVSRQRLQGLMRSLGASGSMKSLAATVGRLRLKLDAAVTSDRIVAVRGVGFRLEGSRRECRSPLKGSQARADAL